MFTISAILKQQLKIFTTDSGYSKPVLHTELFLEFRLCLDLAVIQQYLHLGLFFSFQYTL